MGGPESPFDLSGICCLTWLHVDVSIRRLFFFALKPICETVTRTPPLCLIVFWTVVTENTPGCAWFWTGGRVTLALRLMKCCFRTRHEYVLSSVAAPAADR